MERLLLVGVGGFFGAISRFGFYQLTNYLFPNSIFPFATLAINTSGSIAIGMLFECFRGSPAFQTIYLTLAMGFLGAFTTYSTFSYETIALFKRNELSVALLNVIGNLMLCLVGVLFGEWIGRALKV